MYRCSETSLIASTVSTVLVGDPSMVEAIVRYVQVPETSLSAWTLSTVLVVDMRMVEARYVQVFWDQPKCLYGFYRTGRGYEHGKHYILFLYRCSETSLSACTVSTVLVGDMSTVARARLVDSLMQSELRSEFFV